MNPAPPVTKSIGKPAAIKGGLPFAPVGPGAQA
jgi:hypothetical protein